MKLHRLRIANFAAVREADIEFGQGLNVLYGPNDLGKSTLVDAIRLALLLPHGSTSCDQYVGWTGGRDPVVELTFETEKQRIWRVKKEFGKSGSSLLQESKNGKDFDDVERARKVDGRLREILRWGIPEPGGSGGSKGIPTSFLATALLSTQSDVAAMLRESLQNDPTASGKEQIAAALQAVAQDPLFVALLNSDQARRDEAYTDKGAKKTAKGSVFKVAAEHVRETRDEKERLQRIVAESESAENLLRDLIEKRGKQQEVLATATDQVVLLERLAVQAADRAAAAGKHAELDLRQTQLGLRLHHDQIAAHRQFQPASISKPAHGGDGRLGKIVDLAVGFVLLGQFLRHHLAGAHHARKLAHVRAGAKGAIPRPGKHQNAYRMVARQLIERLAQQPGQIQGHQVERRVVESHGGDAIADVAQDRLLAHGFLFLDEE